jgi:hypothetical protein
VTAPRPLVTLASAGAAAAAEAAVSGVAVVDRCRRADHVWYFDPFHEPTNAPTIYATLTSSAQRLVWVWDPWLNSNDIQALGDLAQGISFRLLTDGACNPRGAQYQKATQFVAEFKQRFPTVTCQVRCFDRDLYVAHDSALSFHDRYLFVDSDVYVVGASLTYHWQRSAGSAVIRLASEIDVNLVRQAFAAYWSHPTFTKALA